MSDRADIPSAADLPQDKTLPMAAYVLYLLGFVTGGVTTVVGLILAYVNRGPASHTHATHYTFLIRTFWLSLASIAIGCVMMVWGAIFSVILIGIPFLILAKLILAATTVWFAVRCVVGLIYLSRDEAYPRPYALVI
ncbi:MAG TPA: hypothetical protein VFW47_13700 [Phenylobacterium sp.]|nr:hypothetical protein [Phenylobacterium sp.]